MSKETTELKLDQETILSISWHVPSPKLVTAIDKDLLEVNKKQLIRIFLENLNQESKETPHAKEIE